MALVRVRKRLARRRVPGVNTPEQRQFGRDGISGLVTRDRALRAREVSTPTQEHRDAAQAALPELLERAHNRPRRR